MHATNPRPNAAPERGARSAHAWQASESRDLERGVTKATRHSRSVRFLRVAIPAGIVLGLVALTAVSWVKQTLLPKIPNASLGRLAVSGTKIMMDAPRLTGYTRDGRGYEVTAKSAAQDLTKPDVLELYTIHGKMAQQDASAIDLTADRGLYDRKTELLILKDHIVMHSSSGYEVHLTEATVNVTKHNVVSEKPVEVQMTNGVVNANRLEVLDDGDLIRFDGGVRMTVVPKDEKEK
jgi:lipopolysaccharide export system protein LptC